MKDQTAGKRRIRGRREEEKGEKRLKERDSLIRETFTLASVNPGAAVMKGRGAEKLLGFRCQLHAAKKMPSHTPGT